MRQEKYSREFLKNSSPSLYLSSRVQSTTTVMGVVALAAAHLQILDSPRIAGIRRRLQTEPNEDQLARECIQVDIDMEPIVG